MTTHKRFVALAATGALLAGLLGLATVTATPALAASTPTTPMWSTQLDFDSGGAAWSESYFAGLHADGLTTAELNMPWGTIEPSVGTFSFTIWDQELANAAAAGIQLIPVFWQSGWSGSPAPWITDFEKTSSGTAGSAPDWWNSTEQSDYFTYVEDTIQNSLAQPGGYGGAILDYGYLDAQWDISGSGGGYTADDVAEFQNVYLPDTYGTIATFNTDEGTSYTSFSQVPAEASGQSLFGVFQAFRAWSVEQTYGRLTAAVRNITASTPLYYYYGGGFGNVTNYANNPDTFFKLAKQYNVTVIADSASNTGMTLAMASLARAYGVKMAEEWTAPSSNSELAAYAVQWLDSYGMTFPQAGGEDFFIHDGTAKDTVGFPIYTSWLPTLKSLSGSYPQQKAALYIDVSQGYGNMSGGSLSGGGVQTTAANIWDAFQSGLAIVTSQEVANGAISLSSFSAVLPLNGTDATVTAYKNAGGTVLTSSSQLPQYATAYATLTSSGTVQVVPDLSSSGTSAQVTLANITTGTAYDSTITFNPTGLGLAAGTYHVVNASGTAVPQSAVSGGICTQANLPAATLTEWSVVPGAAPSGTPGCTGSTSPTLAASPASLSFGNVKVGSTSSAQSVKITNSGGTAATISGVSAPSGFTTTNTCGSSLAAGASCTASVAFSPTAAQAYAGNLTVSSNATNSTLTVALTGTGATSSTNLALNQPITGSSVQQNYVAKNADDGNADTYWESSDGTWPSTLTVDLGSTQTLADTVIDLPPLTAWQTRTQTLSILGSANDSTWTTIAASATYTWNPSTGNTVTIDFPSGTAYRYVRANFTANSVQNGAQVSEWQIFG